MQCSSGTYAFHEGNAIIYIGELFSSGNSKENMSDVKRKKWRTCIKREIRRGGRENRELHSRRLKSD